MSGLIENPAAPSTAAFVCIPSRERNDCTVRACAAAMGVTYEEAYAVLLRVGRRRRCAFKLQKYVQKISFRLGVRAILVARSGTVGKFLEEFPVGTFLVRKNRHAFAIIDGVVHDHAPAKPLYRIKQAWRIEKAVAS